MNNTTYKEKGNNYRAMVIDLARLYHQSASPSFKPSLARDVVIALHEGGLDMDTSRFTVDFDVNLVSFNDEDSGGAIVTAWVHQSDLERELYAGAGVTLASGEVILHDKIIDVVNGLGDRHHVARSLVRLTANRKTETEVSIRNFSEAVIFTITRKGDDTLSVAFFKGKSF